MGNLDSWVLAEAAAIAGKTVRTDVTGESNARKASAVKSKGFGSKM